MEARYHNYSTDQCNAMMMELTENEKHGMETKPKYLPITMYNAIMLLMKNKTIWKLYVTSFQFFETKPGCYCWKKKIILLWKLNVKSFQLLCSMP